MKKPEIKYKRTTFTDGTVLMLVSVQDNPNKRWWQRTTYTVTELYRGGSRSDAEAAMHTDIKNRRPPEVRDTAEYTRLGRSLYPY